MSKSKPIQKIIEDNLSKSRYETIKILRANNYTKEEIVPIEDLIHVSTRSKIREIYTFKKKFGQSNELSKYENISNDYPEFLDWCRITLTIPFYQSLGDTIGYNNGKWEFNYGLMNAGTRIC